MAYYVKRYLDGRRRVVRVRDGMGDILRGLLGKLKDVIGRAIAFCISRLQGTDVGRRIASLLQKALDRLRGSAKEATAAENGNGDLGAARQNLIEALKGFRKAKQEAEKADLTSDVQIGIKSPIENAMRLMESIANDFSLQRIIEQAKRAHRNETTIRPLSLTYDPRVVRPIIPGNTTSALSSGGTFKSVLLKRIGSLPSNGADSMRGIVMLIASKAGNNLGMNEAARQVENVAKSEISRIKGSLGGTSYLHLPESERKAFNNKINSVKRYSESVLGVLRKLSGHTGDIVPQGTKMFEKKVIALPHAGAPLSAMHQGRLPF